MRINKALLGSLMVILLVGWAIPSRVAAIEPAIIKGKSIKLQGIGLREQLSEELYIGALFTEYRSLEPEVLTEPGNTKRMELRIVASKITAKRFGRLWAETIRINNPSKAIKSEQKAIIKFNDMFKDSLYRGDQIVIDHIAGEGTTVYLNGSELGQIISDQFMALLLQTWIGPRPPSDSFKNTILGGYEEGLELLKQEYAVLVPTKNRIIETSDWSGRSSSGVEELELVRPEPRLTDLPKVSEAQKRALAEKKAEEERIAREKAEAMLKAEREKAAREKAARIEAEKERKRKADLAAKRKKEREIKAAVQAALEKEREEFAKKQAEEQEKARLEAQRKREEQAKREIFALSNQYEQSLIEWVDKRVTYPPSAFKRGLEGQGIFKIRITRDGAVQMVKVEKSTSSQLLDREAVKALRRLSPLPPMPDDLPGSDFTFVTPVTFRR